MTGCQLKYPKVNLRRLRCRVATPLGIPRVHFNISIAVLLRQNCLAILEMSSIHLSNKMAGYAYFLSPFQGKVRRDLPRSATMAAQ